MTARMPAAGPRLPGNERKRTTVDDLRRRDMMLCAGDAACALRSQT